MSSQCETTWGCNVIVMVDAFGIESNHLMTPCQSIHYRTFNNFRAHLMCARVSLSFFSLLILHSSLVLHFSMFIRCLALDIMENNKTATANKWQINSMAPPSLHLSRLDNTRKQFEVLHAPIPYFSINLNVFKLVLHSLANIVFGRNRNWTQSYAVDLVI